MSIMANLDSLGVEALKALSVKFSRDMASRMVLSWKMALAIYETFPYRKHPTHDGFGAVVSPLVEL